MERSKRTNTRIHHLYSSTKNKQKKNNVMIEILLSKNTSNRFKFTMTPARAKNL